jgi:hypothetical protein
MPQELKPIYPGEILRERGGVSDVPLRRAGAFD